MTPVFSNDTPLSAFERFDGNAERSRGSNGVHVKYTNGWTVSIQWGPGTYSGNHDAWRLSFLDPAPDSTTAEVACWRDLPDKPHDDFARWADGDTVQGWRSWEDVQQLLEAAADDNLAEPIDLWGSDDANA